MRPEASCAGLALRNDLALGEIGSDGVDEEKDKVPNEEPGDVEHERCPNGHNDGETLHSGDEPHVANFNGCGGWKLAIAMARVPWLPGAGLSTGP